MHRATDLEDLDGVGPVKVGPLPRFAISQAFRKLVQIEDGVVFRVLDLALKQLHDVQERLQGTADVNNCKQSSQEEEVSLTPGSDSKTGEIIVISWVYVEEHSPLLPHQNLA